MRRTTAIIVGVFSSVFVLSACVAEQPEPTPSIAALPSATSTPTVEPSGTTLSELQALYVAAGGECNVVSLRSNSAVADEAGDCENGALLSVYSSQTQRDAAVDALDRLQETNPSPYDIALGPDWSVSGSNAGSFAVAMGGEVVSIGANSTPTESVYDLTSDDGICSADAELTNLELNDALAAVLGFPTNRDNRTLEQDDAIRDYKSAAFARACPSRNG